MSRDVVHVLSSGEYDDYRVHCVVTGNAEEAQQLADRVNEKRGRFNDPVRVEELMVVSQDVQPVVEVLHLETVIYGDGAEEDSTESIAARWPWQGEDQTGSEEVPVHWNWAIIGARRGVLRAWGLDHDRVRAVFAEHRRELLEDEFGELRGMRFREGDR